MDASTPLDEDLNADGTRYAAVSIQMEVITVTFDPFQVIRVGKQWPRNRWHGHSENHGEENCQRADLKRDATIRWCTQKGTAV
jgi:hypothetical protein